jgi:hypothetical protein
MNCLVFNLNFKQLNHFNILADFDFIYSEYVHKIIFKNFQNKSDIYEISGSHGSKYEDDSLLVCSTV